MKTFFRISVLLAVVSLIAAAPIMPVRCKFCHITILHTNCFEYTMVDVRNMSHGACLWHWIETHPGERVAEIPSRFEQYVVR